jgi:predicted AlkP superfamily pyrophosphatase or phosphodiesterase
VAVFPQPMVLPAYGQGTVADLLPGIGAQLGLPLSTDPLTLPAANRFVLLLVDGLGMDLLDAAAAQAPFFSGLRAGGQVITAGTPSTTVTSLTSLGTGLPPGRHGMAGYSFRLDDQGVLNALLWDSATAAEQVQSAPTWFDSARAAGISVASVSPARFQNSGLTRAALRGADFVAITDEADVETWVDEVVAAAMRGDRSVVYAYFRELDHVGHGEGVASPMWSAMLRELDERASRLRAVLPDEVSLIITADHGMIDVPGRNFVIVEEEPPLSAELTGLAGEGRLRHLYTDSPGAVAARWSDRMGDHAWVRTRDEAIAEGWFGPVDDRVRSRFGDVMVAMRTDWAVMSRTLPREWDIVGMHGSLTPVEMRVPLLIA